MNNKVGLRGYRPHHRTTTLTTDGETYMKVSRLREGETALVEFVNDIVSSACGGSSAKHHPIRRVKLLKNQVDGNFRRVKVRTEMEGSIPCLICGNVYGKEDACAGILSIKRDFS